jgi:hypothetical protein
MSSTVEPQTFHHVEQESGCPCPVHRQQQSGPFTAPLGMGFADEVSVETISAQRAEAIYEHHHSYKDTVPDVNVTHHGLKYQSNLVGAITWRFGLGGVRAVRWDENDDLLARPKSSSDYDELPAECRQTARCIVPDVDEEDIETREVRSGDDFLTAARICLAVRMPNLASAALARSQEKVVADYCESNDVSFLITFVRGDFTGAMIRALRDKGWTCTGWASPSEASNRDPLPIRDRFKWRFVCPVKTVREQSTLTDW